MAALITGATVAVMFALVAAAIVLPLARGIWSATATLFGALLYPRSLESRAGMNGGPIRLLAIASSLFAVPAVVLLAGCALPRLAAVLAVTVAGSLLVVRPTAREFRSTRVLGA